MSGIWKIKNGSGNQGPCFHIIYSVLCLTLLLAGSAISNDRAYEPPWVRVKIGDLHKPAMVTGSGLVWRAGKKNVSATKISLAWDGRALRLNNKKVAMPVRISGNGKIEVDGVSFRGSVMVAAAGPPLLINTVDVESYVAGVINHEIDSRWPEAAVDAQAIMARTYATKRARERKDKPFHLDRTVVDQVYGGAAAEDELAWASVKRTRGLVLAYEGGLVSGFYHSSCGGETELPGAVWGGDNRPYQRSVACPYCQDAPRYFWRFPERGGASGKALATLLGVKGEVGAVRVIEKTESGRAALVEIKTGAGSYRLTGRDFRKRMGYDRIWSRAFEVDVEGHGFVFRGSGSGHGAGMCQWGARGMALAGFSFEEILGYYFPGAKVTKFDSHAKAQRRKGI